jgi:hypothetical protein
VVGAVLMMNFLFRKNIMFETLTFSNSTADVRTMAGVAVDVRSGLI